MKIITPENTVTTNGVIAEQAFSITASAKAFKILSSSLYKDKILAIVRELSCNAYDSHIDNGNVEQPFDIHLPTILNPYFKVRDYGIGMSHDDMMSVYTTYFNSTKTESNDFIGALGLGSKSPFSYVDSFNIVSVQNGILKQAYTSYIDDSGTPNITLMTENQTTEENGMEISFYVKESDFITFKDKIPKVFRYFDVKPIVSGYTFAEDSEYETIFNGSNWKMVNCRYIGTMVAVQGNIGYPIAADAIFNLPSHLRSVIEYGNTTINFNIGDLEVSASREELSYDERTSNNIIAVLEDVYEVVRAGIHGEIAGCTSRWDAQVKLCEIHTKYNAGVMKHVNSMNLIFGDKVLIHKTGINIDLILDGGCSVSVKRYVSSDNVNKIKGKSVNFKNIEYSKRVYFVFNDLRIGYVKRLRHHMADNFKPYDIVYFIKFSDWIDGDEKAGLKEDILERCGNPSYLMSSELDTLPTTNVTTVKTTKDSCSVLLYQKLHSGYSSRRYGFGGNQWRYIRLNDPKDIIYVPVYRFGIEDENVGCPNTFNAILELCYSLGIISNDIPIYGLRKGMMKKFDVPNNENFINLFDLVRSHLKKVDTSDIKRYNSIYIDRSSYVWEHLPKLHKKMQKKDGSVGAYVADKKLILKYEDNPENLVNFKLIKHFKEFSYMLYSTEDRIHPVKKVYKQFPLLEIFNNIVSTKQDHNNDEVLLYMDAKMRQKL